MGTEEYSKDNDSNVAFARETGTAVTQSGDEWFVIIGCCACASASVSQPYSCYKSALPHKSCPFWPLSLGYELDLSRFF